MAGLVIKELPPELHRKLREQAARHHRSMTKEVIAVLEAALGNESRLMEAPPPYKGQLALTDELIDEAKRDGRE